MTDIDQLEAGRELDALVAEKVMGWPHITDDDPYRHSMATQRSSGAVSSGSPGSPAPTSRRRGKYSLIIV
jgi:hypothetical protein